MANARKGAQQIAAAYVKMVKERNDGGSGGWMQSAFGSGPNCAAYADFTIAALSQVAGQSGWVVRVHYDVRKGGYPQFSPFGSMVERVKSVPLHSFVSVTYQGREQNGKISTPDWIFDPWVNNKPDIFPYSQKHGTVWPIPEVNPSL